MRFFYGVIMFQNAFNKKTKPRFLIRGPAAQYSESSTGRENGKLMLLGRQEIQELKLVQMAPSPK